MSAGPVQRDEASAEFFDGTARGEFLLRHCEDCGAFSEPQVMQCRVCHSTDLTWQPAGGGAELVSWVVTHGRPGPDGVASRTILAIAQFDEGPWWWSQIADADPDQISAGIPLTVGFERSGDNEHVPVFHLA